MKKNLTPIAFIILTLIAPLILMICLHACNVSKSKRSLNTTTGKVTSSDSGQVKKSSQSEKSITEHSQDSVHKAVSDSGSIKQSTASEKSVHDYERETKIFPDGSKTITEKGTKTTDKQRSDYEAVWNRKMDSFWVALKESRQRIKESTTSDSNWRSEMNAFFQSQKSKISDVEKRVFNAWQLFALALVIVLLLIITQKNIFSKKPIIYEKVDSDF